MLVKTEGTGLASEDDAQDVENTISMSMMLIVGRSSLRLLLVTIDKSKLYDLLRVINMSRKFQIVLWPILNFHRNCI